MDMQRAAEKAMKGLPNGKKDANGVQQPQGALVAIDPHTGYVKAMVGGRGTDQFNRATMAERQPGSAFKPFVFAAALENKFSPSTVINDSPIKIGDWEPQNDEHTFSGAVTMRQVAQHSMNVPTVKIAQKLGIEKVLYYAQHLDARHGRPAQRQEPSLGPRRPDEGRDAPGAHERLRHLCQ